MTLHLDLGKQSAKYQLHPVVVFSILDHYKRRADGQQRVVGTLLGEKRGNQIFIKNSFPVPHQEDEDQVAVDMEYHSNMLQLHQKVNPRESVVGWYTTGDQITYVSSLIHDVYRTQHGLLDANPVHLTVDVALTNFKMGVKAYTGHTVTVGDRSVLARFEQAELSLHANESERIGVDALINGQPDDKQLDAPATILSDFDNLEHSMIKLLEALEVISAYVERVESGEQKGDLEIGRQIATAIAAIPHLDSESFESLFNSNIQDLLMIVYLANLTRAQLTLADRVTGIIS